MQVVKKTLWNRIETHNTNGQLHRTDGPAVEWVNGDKEWYQNGNLHRTDGHAIELANGDNHWYLNGVQYTKKEFNKQTIHPLMKVFLRYR